jgi:hypothetical protein
MTVTELIAAMLELLLINVSPKDAVGHLLVRIVLPHGASMMVPCNQINILSLP